MRGPRRQGWMSLVREGCGRRNKWHEGQKVLEAREVLGDLGDQLRWEEQRGCNGWRGAALLELGPVW
jgi:hypothetical protein